LLDQAASQTERAGQIIRRLRAFVSPQAAVRSAQDLAALVHDALALIRVPLIQRGVRVEQSTQGPMRVFADPVQVSQVLRELLHNALAAMTDVEPARRRLTIRTVVEDERFVRVDIEDQGVGLTNEQLAHLFHPFRTTQPGGLGLGLVICQTIVRDHGGQLWARANAEHGTIFSFTLPCSPGGRES
jgi:two-component system sensor kinase FixL